MARRYGAVVAMVGLLAGAPSQGAAQQGAALEAGQVVELSLPQAMALALDRNRDLALARLELEKAEDQVDEAWGGVLPSVDANLSYTRNFRIAENFIDFGGELQKVRFGTDNNWSLQLQATQPLFDPAVFIGLGAAGRYRALQGEAVRGSALAVVNQARIAYYDVLLAEEAARLNTQSLERVTQTLRETRAMYDAGLTSEFESLRLEVELANVEADLRRADNATLAARRALAVQLGIDPSMQIRTVGSLASLRLEPGAEQPGGNGSVFRTAGVLEPEERAVDELVALAAERRSDLRQLKLTEALRQTEVNLEKWGYLPRLELFGTYQITAQEDDGPNFFGETSDQRSYGTLAGIRLTMPVFTGFQRWNRIEQKQATVEQVRTQYERTLDQTEQLIRTLHDQASEARRRADAQARAVEQAQRGYRIASAEYREGLGGRLQVTDAEVALRRSEFNYAQAVYDYLLARARLDEATGLVPFADADTDVRLTPEPPAGVTGALDAGASVTPITPATSSN